MYWICYLYDILFQAPEKKDSKQSSVEENAKPRPRRSLRLRPVIEVIDVIGSPEKENKEDEAASDKQDLGQLFCLVIKVRKQDIDLNLSVFCFWLT